MKPINEAVVHTALRERDATNVMTLHALVYFAQNILNSNPDARVAFQRDYGTMIAGRLFNTPD